MHVVLFLFKNDNDVKAEARMMTFDGRERKVELAIRICVAVSPQVKKMVGLDS